MKESTIVMSMEQVVQGYHMIFNSNLYDKLLRIRN